MAHDETVKSEAAVQTAQAQTAQTEGQAPVGAAAAVATPVEATWVESVPVPPFVKERLEQAQQALNMLVERGQESRREVEGLLQRLKTGELPWRESPAVQRLETQARRVQGEVHRQLSGLQSRVAEAAARPTGVKVLNRGLDQLARTLGALVHTQPPPQPHDTPRA